MKKFRLLKKVLIILALIGIGLFVWFILIKNFEIPEKLTPEVKTDKIPPSTAVLSPEDKSWHNSDFLAIINDSDLGSGLVDFVPREKGCRYIIEDLGTGRAVGDFRKCDPVGINVSVGEGKVCSSSYQKLNASQGKCKVSTIAFDKADNNSGWKSRVFNIDLIEPEISQIILDRNLFELNKNYLFESLVSDNSKITGCWFYLNGKIIEEKVDIKPVPCENEEECRISANYTFDAEGDYYIRFSCSDIAENLGFSEYQIVKVTTNHPPEISSCQVSPTQETIQTEFQFKVAVSDPEGDDLYFFWDFGNGANSNEQNPKHQYLAAGTYEPKVIVSDDKGETAECSTAWVVADEE